MSKIADEFIGLAEDLERIIRDFEPLEMYWFIAEVENGVMSGYIDACDELSIDKWEADDEGIEWFDLALYCVTHGADFDNITVENFLYKHELTKAIAKKTNIWGMRYERRKS